MSSRLGGTDIKIMHYCRIFFPWPMANLLIYLAANLASQPAFARFNESDANLVDPEERANTETWNDKNSYRYPITWDDDWQKTAVGYRVSAGSLNASRFNFEDNLRIAPNPLDQFTASFNQTRQEDLVEQNVERELRAGWSFIPHTRLSLIGDSDTFKEYGDLGGALVLWEAAGQHTEVYYWSVDNYYKSKKNDEFGFRTKDSKTFGLYSSNLVQGNMGWSIRYEVDTPLDWTHPAAGYRYEYARRRGDARFNIPTNKIMTAYGSIFHEWKFEKKVLLQPTESGQVYKTMHRLSNVYEIGATLKPEGGEIYTGAIQLVRRDADYQNGESISLSPVWMESYAPKRIRRTEGGLVLSNYRPVSKSFALQHGVELNNVSIREDARVWRNVEIKYQLLFDFLLNESTSFALNTTWDIDQVVRDYPYPKKAPFRPWGGGDLQFMMKL
jgi:hypothetical protein